MISPCLPPSALAVARRCVTTYFDSTRLSRFSPHKKVRSPVPLVRPRARPPRRSSRLPVSAGSLDRAVVRSFADLRKGSRLPVRKQIVLEDTLTQEGPAVSDRFSMLACFFETQPPKEDLDYLVVARSLPANLADRWCRSPTPPTSADSAAA
ncbi:hypothetical protein NUU61_006906 [Penicillium alfredii]|uniref:Uncharacterized protein n=1 Tax=Penicillium alfredii TaxID=1506179 RepID=A0A9W9F205_9EURO|nr:uncharacterized protein NUU61_006906 [Penicillium alfredii]KAJ5092036.1 hypothetical protein NUU61_006906 [Penicillium alfredii]